MVPTHLLLPWFHWWIASYSHLGLGCGALIIVLSSRLSVFCSPFANNPSGTVQSMKDTANEVRIFHQLEHSVQNRIRNVILSIRFRILTPTVLFWCRATVLCFLGPHLGSEGELNRIQNTEGMLHFILTLFGWGLVSSITVTAMYVPT